MITKAVFLHDDTPPACMEQVLACCRQEQFDVTQCTPAGDDQQIRQSLPAEPYLVFLPPMQEDCLSVKLAQVTQVQGPPRVVVLCSDDMPDGRYLCLAFREGVDDVIAADGPAEQVAVQVRRAGKLLADRRKWAAQSDQVRVESLQQTCRHLEHRNALLDERLQALASTVGRLATGELRLAESAPALLIVAASASQASSAVELTRHLGFDVKTASSAADALDQLAKRPVRVLLVDGTLPDADAATFARQARKALGDRPVVIIAWSSSPQAEDDLLTPGSGVDDVVLKSNTAAGRNHLVASLFGALR